MGWNYLSIPKLQRLHRLSLGMDKLFHPTLSNRCNELSMPGLKLNHVSKSGQCGQRYLIQTSKTEHVHSKLLRLHMTLNYARVDIWTYQLLCPVRKHFRYVCWYWLVGVKVILDHFRARTDKIWRYAANKRYSSDRTTREKICALICTC